MRHGMFGSLGETTKLTFFNNVSGTNGKIGNVGKVVLTKFADAICADVIKLIMQLMYYILFNIYGQITAFYECGMKCNSRLCEG